MPAPEVGTYGHSHFRVGDPLPAVMVLSDLATLLGLGSSAVWDLYKAGEFKQWELTPAIGKRPRFSGKAVQQWIDKAEADDAEAIETSEGRRYFASARRRLAKATTP